MKNQIFLYEWRLIFYSLLFMDHYSFVAKGSPLFRKCFQFHVFSQQCSEFEKKKPDMLALFGSSCHVLMPSFVSMAPNLKLIKEFANELKFLI